VPEVKEPCVREIESCLIVVSFVSVCFDRMIIPGQRLWSAWDLKSSLWCFRDLEVAWASVSR